MPDVFSRKKRSEIMSHVRHERTAAEEVVGDLLRELGLRFRRNVRRLPGQPDLVLRSIHAVVFVHGCFWHGHSACRHSHVPTTNSRFWKQKFRYNARRDRRNARLLREMGWRVVTVWECSLKNPKKVLTHLKRVLRKDTPKLGMPPSRGISKLSSRAEKRRRQPGPVRS